jgi:hypothetical protein
MPGRRTRKVDCADGSAASDVAVVVVSLVGHVDGVERMVGILMLAVLRPCSSQTAVRRPNSGQRAA